MTKNRITSSLAVCITSMLLVSHAIAKDATVLHNPADYQVLPHLVDKDRLPTMTSGMMLNDDLINHRTHWLAKAAAVGGDSRNTAIMPNLLYAIDSQVEQGVTRDNVFVSDQRGEYFQLKGVQNRHNVALTITEPKAMLGMLMQATLTGECEALGREASDAAAQCSYTPALVVDRDAIDPVFFVPTVISQEGDLGQEISPESLLILAQPGFQNTGAHGEVVGLDIYLPNMGLQPGNDQSTTTGVKRQENSEYTPQAGYSRVRQVLKSNAREAVFARTLHGLPYLHDNDEAALAPALGLLGQWLPDVVPELQGSDSPHSTNINMNLMRAANNSRIPANSWTLYQAGVGRSDHPQAGTPPPDVWFNNIWFGLSPVTDRRESQDSFIARTRARKLLGVAGAEGGTVKPLHLIVEDENGFNIVDSELLTTPLDDYYLQLYLTLFSQDVNLTRINTLEEQTNWDPHLSVTGNLTGNNYLWRYHAGVIASSDTRAYLGGDFRHHLGDWSYQLGGIHYNEQDVDYFSQVSATLARRFELRPDWQAKLYTDGRYAYDRESQDKPLVDPPDNYSRLGVNVSYNARASLDIYHYLDVFDDTITNSPGADFHYNLNGDWNFKSWLHPGTQFESYGAGLEYNTRQDGQTLTLGAGWDRVTREYGQDLFGHDLETTQDIFVISLKVGR